MAFSNLPHHWRPRHKHLLVYLCLLATTRTCFVWNPLEYQGSSDVPQKLESGCNFRRNRFLSWSFLDTDPWITPQTYDFCNCYYRWRKVGKTPRGRKCWKQRHAKKEIPYGQCGDQTEPSIGPWFHPLSSRQTSYMDTIKVWRLSDFCFGCGRLGHITHFAPLTPYPHLTPHMAPLSVLILLSFPKWRFSKSLLIQTHGMSKRNHKSRNLWDSVPEETKRRPALTSLSTDSSLATMIEFAELF